MDEVQGPRTIGELRRVLAEAGSPWTVNSRLGDADPLPDLPRGGQRDEDIPEGSRLTAVAADADLGALLKATPPANPFLRARWVELGLMATADAELRNRGEAT